MSFNDKPGIPILGGYKLGSSDPMDVRTIADDAADLQSLIDNGVAYEGLEVYVKSTKKKMQYNGTEFVEVATGGGSNVDIHIEDDTLVINTDGTSSGSGGGGSGSTSKKYTFSGVPVHLGDDLISHLCGVEITDTEIINELQKVINNEKIVQVYYGGGYDISKSSYLFTSAINFFAMDIITTGILPSSGPGVAIIYANNQCYYCDTDFWNLNDGVPISKTINLTFKFMDISGEASSGSGSGGGTSVSTQPEVTIIPRSEIINILYGNNQNIFTLSDEKMLEIGKKICEYGCCDIMVRVTMEGMDGSTTVYNSGYITYGGIIKQGGVPIMAMLTVTGKENQVPNEDGNGYITYDSIYEYVDFTSQGGDKKSSIRLYGDLDFSDTSIASIELIVIYKGYKA